MVAHPVMYLDGPSAPSWVTEGPLEERIVAYADKRATQRVVSLEQRFARWRRRHVEHTAALERSQRSAQRLEMGLCTVIGIRPEEVQRLRWVDEALAHATASGALQAASG